MRTHRTVYRVLRTDGTEAYRGKRSAIIRFLGAKQRVGLQTMRVQHGRYDPLLDQGPTAWEDDGPADKFRTRSTP